MKTLNKAIYLNTALVKNSNNFSFYYDRGLFNRMDKTVLPIKF
jgi:hypothetical protein